MRQNKYGIVRTAKESKESKETVQTKFNKEHQVMITTGNHGNT